MVVDISLGLDSFAACLAAGLLPAERRVGFRLPALFGCCDAGATLLGDAIPHRVLLLPDSATYLGCAVLLGLAARRSRSVLYALPVLLGLDDFLAPVEADPLGTALLHGATSFVMALAGFGVSVMLRRACNRLRPALGKTG
ncbi:hypothetical protein [Lichenicoccus sp.]|uniref:hypothetical protein n=1 Tax=Lichenicoccus sp. TaxID=2781899 RepID=UPI003D0B9BA1